MALREACSPRDWQVAWLPSACLSSLDSTDEGQRVGVEVVLTSKHDLGIGACPCLDEIVDLPAVLRRRNLERRRETGAAVSSYPGGIGIQSQGLEDGRINATRHHSLGTSLGL